MLFREALENNYNVMSVITLENILGIPHGQISLTEKESESLLKGKKGLLIEHPSSDFSNLPENSAERVLINTAKKKNIILSNCSYRRDSMDVSDFVETFGLDMERFELFVGLQYFYDSLTRQIKADNDVITQSIKKNYHNCDTERLTTRVDKLKDSLSSVEDLEMVMSNFASPILQFIKPIHEHYFLIPNTIDFRHKVDGEVLYVFGPNHAQSLRNALYENVMPGVTPWKKFMSEEQNMLKFADKVYSVATETNN
ncbi:MAG: hypothetical protein ABH828_00950 [archaeon]